MFLKSYHFFQVGKLLLNALLYPGIKTNMPQKNAVVAIFHTSVMHLIFFMFDFVFVLSFIMIGILRDLDFPFQERFLSFYGLYKNNMWN